MSIFATGEGTCWPLALPRSIYSDFRETPRFWGYCKSNAPQSPQNQADSHWLLFVIPEEHPWPPPHNVTYRIPLLLLTPPPPSFVPPHTFASGSSNLYKGPSAEKL